MTKVSVIVPVYNVEKYIDKCLNTLVNQTLEDIEIIVVNDGTLDSSQDIIDEYVKKYPKKIKSFIKENGGLGSARNYGIKYAEGEYIGYVDSDDYVEVDMFKRMYDKAKDENCDIVICNYSEVINNTKKVIPFFLKSDNDKTNSFFNNVSVWNKIYKKELISDIEFKSKVWYEDLAFTCKAIMKSKKIGFINESFYNYLIREGSIMNTDNLSRNLEILDAFDDVMDFISKNEEYKIYYPEIEFLAIYHIYISAVVRVINSNANMKDKIEIINKLKGYININFKDFKKNKYINYLNKNRKLIYKLVNLKMYRTIRFIFKVKERI